MTPIVNIQLPLPVIAHLMTVLVDKQDKTDKDVSSIDTLFAAIAQIKRDTHNEK